MNHKYIATQRASALEWAKHVLANQGFLFENPIEVVREMPWSTVYRIPSSQGNLYLKLAAKPFGIETILLPYLSRYYPALLPHVLATNPELHAIIMNDSGEPLRPILQKKYQVNLAMKAIDHYATIQIGMIAHVDELLALGVLDWRLSTLPNIYLDLLAQKEALIHDGLTADEIERLIKMQPQVLQLCIELAQYQIPETIEHGDFHDNNILMSSKQQLLINDWGDTVITHPFFSLTTCLSSVRRNHLIESSSPCYATILHGYLKHWLKFEPQNRLMAAFTLAKRLSPIKFVLSFHRITLCGDGEACDRYRGFVADALKLFLKAEHPHEPKI